MSWIIMKWYGKYTHTHSKTVNANYSAINECIDMQFFLYMQYEREK